MYLRTIARRNKDGSQVRYLQLAHNEWDPARRQAIARVLYSFGREDQLDREAIMRLVASLSRALEPDQALLGQTAPELRLLDSRPMGGAWLLDGLWRRLGIEQVLGRLLAGRRAGAHAERVVFALVCNRALEPLSKLAATGWLARHAWVPGIEGVDEDACYRVMDRLLEVEQPLGRAVWEATADLLDPEVDLLFFDTTSTYFQIDQADAPIGDAEGADEQVQLGFRAYGHSKDHRGDLPQMIVGMAVTRTGIPIRVWCWPGNTTDSALIRQVRDDLKQWKLARVVWVADRGFASAENRRYLQRAGGHYILGEKLRGDSKEAAAALSRQGRYHTVAGNLQVKEVIIDEGVMRDRFVVCRNPEQAARDRAVRERQLTDLEQAITGSDRLSAAKRAKLAAELGATPGGKRFLRTTKGGLLRIDGGAVTAEARLDGKFLLRTADPTLSAEDVALGYKQLLEVERGWRDLKTTLELRPIYHRLERRIRAHVLLCWLALLLIRIAEQTCADTWRNLRDELQRTHLVTYAGPAGTIRQRTEPSAAHRGILRALGLPEPPRFLHLDATA